MMIPVTEQGAYMYGVMTVMMDRGMMEYILLLSLVDLAFDTFVISSVWVCLPGARSLV